MPRASIGTPPQDYDSSFEVYSLVEVLVRALVVLFDVDVDDATDNDGLSGPSLVRLVVLVTGPVCGLLGSRPWLQDEVIRVWIWSFSLRFSIAHTPAGPNSS